MNSLDSAIREYKKRLKTTGPLAYAAAGALEILHRVEELRNAYKEDMRTAWITRAADGGDRYHQAKWVCNELNNLMIDSPILAGSSRGA